MRRPSERAGGSYTRLIRSTSGRCVPRWRTRRCSFRGPALYWMLVGRSDLQRRPRRRIARREAVFRRLVDISRGRVVAAWCDGRSRRARVALPDHGLPPAIPLDLARHTMHFRQQIAPERVDDALHHAYTPRKRCARATRPTARTYAAVLRVMRCVAAVRTTSSNERRMTSSSRSYTCASGHR